MHIELSSYRSNWKLNEKWIDSFCSRIWFEKHQWFIRYRDTSHEKSRSLFLYAVPYAFAHFLYDRVKKPDGNAQFSIQLFFKNPIMANLLSACLRQLDL
jgi:hypothetical protein